MRFVIERRPKSCSAIAGALARFCFMKGYAFWPASVVMFYVLLVAIRGKKPGASFLIGYLFGVLYFFSSLYWVKFSFVCVGLSEALGYAAAVVLSLYLAVYPAFACCISSKFATNNHIFFCCSWVCFEYLRGVGPFGFPWNLIGYSTYDIPYFGQIASVFGIYGVSFLWLITIVMLFEKRTIKYGITLFVLIMVFGYHKNTAVKSDQSNTDITIVQASINQASKMSRFMHINNLNAHIDLSDMNTHAGRNRLIIWPETSIYGTENLDYVIAHIVHDRTYLVSGVKRYIPELNKLNNSAIVIGKTGKPIAYYDKKRLLPFGEYIPEFLSKLGFVKIKDGVVNFASGASSGNIKINNDIPEFVVAICYEIVFPGSIVTKTQRPQWILNLTNDAWFGDEKSDEQHQHLRTTVYRAIEEGLPIVRAANNGISCIIDCHGNVLESLSTNVVGAINSTLPTSCVNTIYSSFGNISVLSLVAAVGLLAYAYERRRKVTA